MGKKKQVTLYLVPCHLKNTQNYLAFLIFIRIFAT